MTKKPAWLVQTNLNARTASLFEWACEQEGNEFIPFESRAFSKELPPKVGSPVLIYGSARMSSLLEGNEDFVPGIIPIDAFYRYHYYEHLLNTYEHTTTLSWVKLEHFTREKMFVRPISDNKEFDGGLYSYEELLYARDFVENKDIAIQISPPQELFSEWRLFVVNGKVSTGSHYRFGGKETLVFSNVPEEVIELAEYLCTIYQPASIFVMDICRTANDLLKVVECNGFNSCGFYAASVHKFVKDVNNYYENF